MQSIGRDYRYAHNFVIKSTGLPFKIIASYVYHMKPWKLMGVEV
jgi:hypothetical protein